MATDEKQKRPHFATKSLQEIREQFDINPITDEELSQQELKDIIHTIHNDAAQKE